MSVRYANSGNNRIDHRNAVSGMSNYCFRGNSPMSDYLNENKSEKYLFKKLRKLLLHDIEKVINDERAFKHQKEKLYGFRLYYVLSDIIEGCDYNTLKNTKKLMKIEWEKGVSFLLSITE